ncbi:MAG: hypothetical protein K0Q95_2085 [Bacteroidota bacterium]|jgi:hypothetical protein|nr:hypothetical protein [Bacteroidota bacterium]
MKKFIIAICFSVVCLTSNARGIVSDSLDKKPRVLCSFFLNTAAGAQQYRKEHDGVSYREKSGDQRMTFPFDLRFYFFKNHLGIGFTRFTTIGSTNGYESYSPFAIVHKDRFTRKDNLFYISYNFNLKPLETHRVAPYFQINHTFSTRPFSIILSGTLGMLYKLNDLIAVNAAVNGGYGTSGARYEFNAGLCFRATQRNHSPQQIQSVKQKDSISRRKQRFLFEIGGGITNTNKQYISTISRYPFDVDTVDYFQNDLTRVRLIFPSIALGYTAKNQSILFECSVIKNSVNQDDFDSERYIYARSSDLYLSLGYYMNDVAAFRRPKVQRKVDVFGGIRMALEFKESEMSVKGRWSVPDYRHYQTVHSFESYTYRLLLETGLRKQFSRHLFGRAGCALNTIGYINGSYKMTDRYNPLNADGHYRQIDRKYDQILFIGNSNTARLFHNFFIKLGYSF